MQLKKRASDRNRRPVLTSETTKRKTLMSAFSQCFLHHYNIFKDHFRMTEQIHSTLIRGFAINKLNYAGQQQGSSGLGLNKKF
jgi:hypothetical protein